MENPFELLKQSFREELQKVVLPIATELAIVKDRLAKINKYMAYPDWVPQKDALEIINVSYPLLKTAVDEGLIRAMTMSESGNKRVYNKEDCLKYAETRAGLISQPYEEKPEH